MGIAFSRQSPLLENLAEAGMQALRNSNESLVAFFCVVMLSLLVLVEQSFLD